MHTQSKPQCLEYKILWAAAEDKGIIKNRKSSRSVQDLEVQKVSLKLTNSFSTKFYFSVNGVPSHI